MRERVISGFDDPKAKDDGITDFVKELKVTHPPAAAGLLGKLIPPADEAEPSGMIIGEVNILSIPRGTFLAAEQAKRIMSKDITIEEAKQIVADAMVSKAISDRKFDGEFIEIEEVIPNP